MTTIRKPMHVCRILYSHPQGGEIEQCDNCGRYWRGVAHGNPDFDKWVRIGWLGRKLRRLP